MKNTEEGNKIIAEFMGFTWKEPGNINIYGVWQMPKYLNYDLAYKLRFDSCWDWLMPVAEKIFLDRRVSDFVIRPGETKIKMRYVGTINSPHIPENSSITECFIAVVKFIEWHNLQTK